ncbi:class I adenylate-forming enzyme family protein [Cytobacillus purgationiresistens]|uniref:Crotonobetaine/carnitine-CoA ligase n=1 Tax=Cytobacillus purgationiresistens TaxID=863449 RepID=A0ABU0AGM3_9BACI|nr:class I adenylate-forming enzyme family protein [Cytobacillus purgationiresistens]MDQ0270398.1 crotonobetaine/carnitine-CoA ligase [Cytobacillus purgationiresistens]
MLTHGNHTIYTYLVKQAEVYRDKPFLYFRDESISYASMLERSNQVAHWLINKGIKKGDTVAVMSKNSPHFYDLWFGCAAIGAIILPINTASTARELEYFLSHSDSKAILYDEDFKSNDLQQVSDELQLKTCHSISGAWRKEVKACKKDFVEMVSVSGDDVCTIMYTSGTTSMPKGVMITHENYLFAGHSSVLYQGLSSYDRYLILLPLFHANAQYYTSMAMLVVGGTIVLLEKFSVSTFWEDVEKYKPTVSSFVATIIKILLELPVHPYERVHAIRQIGYGLFVNKQDIENFQSRFGIRLFQWYGMTESITTNIVTPLYENMPYDPNTGISAIGKPALGHEVKMVDENGNEVPPFTAGQMIIKGPSLMKGYYKNEEATRQTIRTGWLYTGDQGYANHEGYIWFVDRDKDVIKRAGENVSSIEVENVISGFPGISDCAVIGVPDKLRDESIIAFIQTAHETISLEELQSFCEKNLSYFKIPQAFQMIEEFPRTSIGKVKKNVLRERYSQQIK